MTLEVETHGSLRMDRDFDYWLYRIITWDTENCRDLLRFIHNADIIARTDFDDGQLIEALIATPGAPTEEQINTINGIWAVDKLGQCLWSNNNGDLVVISISDFEQGKRPKEWTPEA